MAVLHLPPPSSVEVRSLWGRETSPKKFGEAGMLLEAKMADAWQQWARPEESRHGSRVDETREEELDELTYQSVKLPTVAKILVHFKRAEPLKPRHFSLDELDNDDE